MSILKHYLHVWVEFIRTYYASELQFRFNIFLMVLLDVVFYAVTIFYFELIFNQISHIGPWSKDQVMFFMVYMLIIDAFHMSFFAESFWMLSEQIRQGDLDYVLLKPIHSLFICFFRYPRPNFLPLAIILTPIIYHYGSKVLTPIDWLALPIYLLLSLSLYVMCEMLISVMMFWMTEGRGVNFLRMQLQNIVRFPDFVYERTIRRLFTFVLPIFLAATGPLYFVYDKGNYLPLLGLVIFNILFFWILVKLWNRGLKQYESASS